MSLYQSIFELIDLRSFSNLWFWIALAVMWSAASNRVLGVPFDMVLQARRQGGQAAQDLQDMVRINVTRMLYVANVSGLWLLGLACFGVTVLVLLGFVYRVEFAQAVFLLGFPMILVRILSLHTASQIAQHDLQADALCARLTRLRTYVQLLGIVSLFVTAMWGMYQNLSIGPLGG